MIDVNVSLSRWPCRRLPQDETSLLVRELQRVGITQAWACSFEALLHHDIAAVNQRIAEECKTRGAGTLVPVGAINPLLPNWEDDLRRCAELHGMQVIRLHPGYHGYGLSDPAFRHLLQKASERQLVVQIAVRQEDTRTQHRLLSVDDVDLKLLKELLAEHPQLPLILLNAHSSANLELHSQLCMAGQVYFDISTLEGLAGLEKVLKSIPPERILLGTHAPFFTAESGVLKLRESVIPGPHLALIQRENAERLLKGTSSN